MDGRGELDLIDHVRLDVDLEKVLLGHYDTVVSLEVEDTVFIHMLSYLISRMVNLIQLDQVTFIVSIDCEVFLVNYSQELPLTRLGINGENEISLVDFKVGKLDNLCVEHHLIHPLSAVLVVACHYVEVVARVLVLESAHNRVPLLGHLGIDNLLSLPVLQKVELIRDKDLEGAVAMDSHHFNSGYLKTLIIV